MKKLLSILLAVAMLFSLGLTALAEEEANYDDQIMLINDLPEDTIPIHSDGAVTDLTGSIVILHSNDVHGAIDGYAKMAVLKEMYQLMGADVYVMDAGDFIQGETAVSVSQGASAVGLMNMVGYDAAAPGNHEFDYGYENLKKLERSANFPILAANVTREDGLAFGDHKVFETSTGVKLGVFGLDTPETATKAHPAKIAGVKFAGGEELVSVAQGQVDALKAEGADYIVCLGHLGIDDESAANGNRSIDLLKKVSGVDVFIDGHSHSTLEQLSEKTDAQRVVNGTVVTSTGTKFENIGVVTIAPDGVISTENQPAKDVGVAEDSEIAAECEKVKAEVEAIYGAVFAKSLVDLNGEKAPGNRTEETNLGDLITDAMVWQVTKDGGLDVEDKKVVAITNGGGIRAAIAAGDITKNDVNKVLPFGNTVATVYITGEALLEALEASTFCTPAAVGGFPQVSGLTMTIDTATAFDAGENYAGTTYAAPKSVNRVTIDSVNGEDFDPAATYAVITNDFVAAGGDTYYTFTTSPNIVDTGVPLDEALMAYITEALEGTIGETYAAPQGRIAVKYAGVEPGAWYTDAAKDVMDKGLMTSTGNGFDPAATVTRATVFQTLYNLAGKPQVNNRMATWPDAQGKWYENAARWAEQMELTTGTDKGFEGDKAVTRQELVTILYRYEQSEDKANSDTNILTFNDAELVQSWAVDAFRWAVHTGVVSGKDGNRLAPEDTATRAELAKVLSNYTGDFFSRAAQ